MFICIVQPDHRVRLSFFCPHKNGESTGFSFGRAQSVEGQGSKNLYKNREIDRVFVFGFVIASRAGRWLGV